ncbi:MarR family transcriptional regulator [Sphaerisporangium siamense]|uniref:DNA-binding MarR family transcriptional regulator n=1 Tax=Sphaerisporangium siamense TaxID=795645 RepID=A0A7W7DGT0_9ACTN|nr:MarR family transcriptional regulator [Sphaerisporangium siamense]MBB4705456.1 DNA-binding MarR family transcriptional regulator [Sphaerisporangium siamense]GII86392.1 MarR family transcriptional regulator [Sphaerisporangium siamense]
MRHEGDDDRDETGAPRQDEVDALVPGWAAELPASLVAVLELSKRVSRIGGLLEQATRAEMAELGLTYAEFDVLAALHRAGPPYRLKPSDLTRSLFLTSGGTSNVLQRLARAGYVDREADAGDGRSRWVRLTEEGRRVAATALDASGRAHSDVMAAVPEETVRKAADALREVLLVIGRRRVR